MKSVMNCPFIPMSHNIASHRAAQGIIYADILNHMGYNIKPYLSPKLVQANEQNEISKNVDFNEYDTMFVYHGNDYRIGSNQINLFGGLDNFPHAYNVRNFSKFKGKVYSISIDMPEYHKFLRHKMNLFIGRKGEDKMLKEFREIDWNNYERICITAEVINPWNWDWEGLVIGDSHAICMYRPGYNVNSNPFKTLNGALKLGLHTFITPNEKLKTIEFYFGNIDIRHHVYRHGDMRNTIDNLVKEYIKQVNKLPYKHKRIYELLPIENESRYVPQSGYFEGTPFYGTQQERNEARLYFKEQMIKKCKKTSIEFVQWIPEIFYNNLGELSFDVMEKPKSIHLSREFYPYWNGSEYNDIIKNKTIEDFLS